MCKSDIPYDIVQAASGTISGVYWPHFQRYRLDEDDYGGVIVPEPRAGLRWYNPWRGADPLQPLGELMRLTTEVQRQWEEGSRLRLGSHQKRRLLTWCRQYGLLGVLPMQLQEMRTTQHEYRREGHAWVGGPTAPRWYGYRRRTDGSLQKVPAPKPRVILQPIEGRPREVDINSPAWWRYFPQTYGMSPRERYKYSPPPPCYLDFWEVYAEPVTEFFSAADQLLWGLWALQQVPGGVNGCDPSVPIRGQHRINALAAHVSPALILGEGAPTLSKAHMQIGWDGDSLIAHYAAMIVSGVATGHQIKTCARCGAPFIAKAVRELYCTTTCQRTAARKRNRDRKSKPGGRREETA